MAAGTAVVTSEGLGSVKKLKFVWTSGTSGEAGTVTKVADHRLTGVMTRVVIVPAASGDQPDDLFDVTITNSDGIDVLLGNGANCSNASTTHILESGLLPVSRDQLTLNVSGAGSANKGTVILYVE